MKRDRLVAAATQRSKSCLVADAIRAYVENNEWMGAIQAALEETDAGNFASDKDVATLVKGNGK